MGQSDDVNKKEKDVSDVKAITAEEKADGNDKRLEKKGGAETGEENKTVEKNEQGKSVGAQKSGSVKSGKKKIIKKIVKQNVNKTAGNSASNQNDKLDEKENGKKIANSEIPDLQDGSSVAVAGAKTSIRKKVMRKTTHNGDMQDKQKDNLDLSSAAVLQGTSVKKTVKRKIIKRVAKKKVAVVQSGGAVADKFKDADGDEIKVDETEIMEGQAANTGDQVNEIKRSGKKTVKQDDDMVDLSKTEIKADENGKGAGDKSGQEAELETEADKPKVSQNANHSGNGGKSKDGEKSKYGKEKKGNDGKDLSRSISNKELKDKRKPEEPPRHPGLILQTKWNKDSKVSR